MVRADDVFEFAFRLSAGLALVMIVVSLITAATVYGIHAAVTTIAGGAVVAPPPAWLGRALTMLFATGFIVGFGSFALAGGAMEDTDGADPDVMDDPEEVIDS